jgi:hypothetical protein
MDFPITDPSRLLSLPAESRKSPERGKSNYVTVVELWRRLEPQNPNGSVYFINEKGDYAPYELWHTFVSR